MQNKVNLEAIKHWFYNVKIAHLQDVPTHYFEHIYSLGLIDTKLCETALKAVAIYELIDMYARVAAFFAAVKSAESAPQDKENTMPEKMKQRFIKNAMETTKQWLEIQSGAAPTDRQANELKDMYQRAQVFYSKPLMTTSNLDTISGISGAPNL